jgi:hypothetical protein
MDADELQALVDGISTKSWTRILRSKTSRGKIKEDH